ncbi:hypothetical protein M407DRAFT_33669 [Tulasnella calospora MUT 4182]|uniref:Uncharacterized protein n=1 Tax=Tulasnella calospora MUT 4182 TaxID=1051891 RepID=A0A0C3Q2M6_9AGAM|nr:hypothetical protein M407DRAFT_33669 [Tulasnella calospora MUT 4182]
MSSGLARLLTSPEFRDAIREDEEVAKAKVVAKANQGEKAVIAKAKKAWRAKDECKAAKWAGERKLKMLKAPTRPPTPDDAFFAAEINGQELIIMDDVSGDEEDEEGSDPEVD